MEMGYFQVCLDRVIIFECAGVFKIVKGRQHSNHFCAGGSLTG